MHACIHVPSGQLGLDIYRVIWNGGLWCTTFG
jgi:hypothetical protein